ncbi:MAG: putative hydroxymethylpyrimidine transporter CytX [Bacillota bacterium]|nr:putative hydroxymethylpyrimidine transporter CytX [Bacillota bacterium]
MNKIKNSSMFLLWTGAAISIAEIYTGGLVAPLGISKGIAAIVIGHIIGTLLLAVGGYISFSDKRNAMDKVRDSLGPLGAKLVAAINVLQLIGWSAIMIIQGGRAISGMVKISYSISLLIVAAAVFLWAYFFNNHSKRVNDISVIILVILCFAVFFKLGAGGHAALSGNINFTTAIELSISMPVSWLPLIGDYAKDGTSKKGVFLSSFWGYFFGSVLMYIMGCLITVYTGKDVIEYISGMGIAASLIVLLSTVTTTFIDVYSAVISSKQIFTVKNENLFIVIYSILATGLAFVFPMESYQDFLLTIGSVFVPVYTVVFIDYFIRKKTETRLMNYIGVFAAVLGTVIYKYFSNISFGIPTVYVFIITSCVYLGISILWALGRKPMVQ